MAVSVCVKGVALLAAAVFPILLHAQAFPAKPIRILVGFTPGAGVDIAMRLIAPRMGEALGQQIVIDWLMHRRGAAARRI